ncbi:MAG: hypothetical protein HOP15_16385, partial [Planctomycetes bacterium]|nr:hypothetical protein [Planctomycetota bacterium]
MSEIPNLPAHASENLAAPRLAAPHTARPAGQTAGARLAAPAFEALFERLTTRAAELEQQSKTLSEPADLPAVLDTARSSLADALTLGEELLEA